MAKPTLPKTNNETAVPELAITTSVTYRGPGDTRTITVAGETHTFLRDEAVTVSDEVAAFIASDHVGEFEVATLKVAGDSTAEGSPEGTPAATQDRLDLDV